MKPITTVVALDDAGELQLTVEWDDDALTPERVDRVNRALEEVVREGNPIPFSPALPQVLTEIILSWDFVDDDGVPLPITLEVMDGLSIFWLQRIFSALVADANRRDLAQQAEQAKAIAAFLAAEEKFLPRPRRQRMGILTTVVSTDLVEGGQLTVVWDADVLTGPMLMSCAQGQMSGGVAEPITKLLVTVLRRWDLRDAEGKAVPLTRAAIGSQPAPLLRAILTGIVMEINHRMEGGTLH